MTFNQLFSYFQKQHGQDHDVIFFSLLFTVSNQVKTKEQFVERRDNEIDFKIKKFNKLCNLYFIKQCPLTHIIGKTTFTGLEFQVSKKVLSPRDVTEQMTLDFIATHKNIKSGQLLDLCCGCGCIGISIKKHLPQFIVTCVDKYWGPIFDTHANAKKHKTAMTIDCKDAIDYLNTKSSIEYLISNPPYINPNNFSNKAMFKWENKKALIAPENGLYFYKRYFDWLSNHNFKEAWLEIGYDLERPLRDLSSRFPSIDINFIPNKQYVIIKRKL